jgi:hypothetical protein
VALSATACWARYFQALRSRRYFTTTLFIEITPQRNIPVSVSGLVILSIVHAWLFGVLQPSIPGRTWLRKGLFWGVTIWSMYWLFQEWFIYNTLLGEPLLLNVLELSILMLGSLVEGAVIAFFWRADLKRAPM